MHGPSTISEQDLRRLLDIVSPDAAELAGTDDEMPESVLRGLGELIPCANISYCAFDARRRDLGVGQELCFAELPPFTPEDGELFFDSYWDCAGCSYPETSGDHDSVITWLDFYSEREFRDHPMAAYMRNLGLWHELIVCLTPIGGMERRVLLCREPGDVPFSERDRLLLTLMRPHLVTIKDRVEAQRRVAGIELTPRQWQLLERVAVGATNRQIARELGLSEGTVRKHLENIYARLGVGSRTEALARVRADGPLTAAGASSV